MGDNATALGAALDSLPLIRKGIWLLQRDALENNLSTWWGAHGSFLHNYGVAFLRQGELTGSHADIDSARVWLNSALHYRTIGLDYLEYVETQRRLAQVDLAAARLEQTGVERRSRLESARAHVGEARRAQQADTHRVEVALTDLLDAEVCIDLGATDASSAPLVAADSLLERISPLLPVARYPVPNAELHRQRGRLHAIRWAIGHDEADRRLAMRELSTALTVFDRAQCPHFHRHVRADLAAVTSQDPDAHDSSAPNVQDRDSASPSAPGLRSTASTPSPQRTGVRRSRRSALPPGLVGWWSAEGSFADVTSAHGGITAGGVVFTDGKVGRGFLFDGNPRSYIVIPNDPALHPKSNRLTIAGWIKPDFRVANSFDTILSKRDLCDESLTTYCLNVVKAPADVPVGQIVMTLGQPATGSATGRSTRPVPDDGTFHHVAGTYDGSMIRVYLDGVLVGSAPRSGPLLKTDSAPVISHPGGLCAANSWAVIDEVMFFDRALTQAEIAGLVAGGQAEGEVSRIAAPEEVPRAR